MSADFEPQTVIARRIARELKPGMLVNLGVGIPTLEPTSPSDPKQALGTKSSIAGGIEPPPIGFPVDPMTPAEPKKLNGVGTMADPPSLPAPVGVEPAKQSIPVTPPPITPGKPDPVDPLALPSLEPKMSKEPMTAVEPPKVDFPKTDPKADLPKVDLPKVDAPAIEQPKADQPKIDVKITQPTPVGPGGIEKKDDGLKMPSLEPKELLSKPGSGGSDPPPSIGPPPLVVTPKTPVVDKPIGTPMGELPITSPITPKAPGQGLPAVTNHAEERIYTQPGETFEQLSQRLYGSPKYATALLEYNRKHVLAKANIQQNPPQLQPNQAIYYPHPNILEIQFGGLISQGATAAKAPAAPAVKITPLGGANPPTADPTVAMTLTQPRWVFDIARQTLGDGQRWVEILRLNPSLQTEQPIPTGTTLRLPATAKLP